MWLKDQNPHPSSTKTVYTQNTLTPNLRGKRNSPENSPKLASILSKERVILFPISTTLEAAIAHRLTKEKNKRRFEVPIRAKDSESTKAQFFGWKSSKAEREKKEEELGFLQFRVLKTQQK